MHIGTWNVQKLKNKREIIIKNLKELKLDIIALTKKRGSELETISSFL
jgi:exonuclease III